MKRDKSVSWPLGVAILLLALGTNRWLGWGDGIRALQASDVTGGYMPVALAAPRFPQVALSFHHAQRFFLPYLTGTLSWATGIGIPTLFSVEMGLIQVGLLSLFWFLLGHLELPPRRRLLVWAALVFQPYALRYYWLVPGMASDLSFELGALVLIFGLYLRRPSLAWFGLAVAALSRQTALLLLPGALLWIFWSEGWRGRARAAWAAAFVAGAGGLYELTGWVASRFATPSVNSEHVLGLLAWLRSPEVSVGAFAEHMLRCALPLLPASFLLLSERPSRWPRESWCCLMMSLAIAAQPFLAGPEITGQNAARLVTLGLPSLLCAWAFASRAEWSARLAWPLGLTLFAGSFHHVYTWLGPPGPKGTALLQIAVAAAALGLARLRRHEA